jgi:hypothetical protein
MALNLKSELQQLRDFSQQLKLNKSIELINNVLQDIETQTLSIPKEAKDTNLEKPSNSQLSSDLEATFLLQESINRILVSGLEILQTIQIQENTGQIKPAQFELKYEENIAKLSVLQCQKTEELQKIDQTAQLVKEQVQPFLKQFELKLKQRIKQVIDSVDITSSELKKAPKLSKKLSVKIADELKKINEQFEFQIQHEIQQHVKSEIKRLQAFSDTMIQMRQGINQDFLQMKSAENQDNNEDYIGKGIAFTASYLTRFGGIWPGYQVAGVKGAAVGAVGGMGTIFGANFVIKMIALPLTWQISLAISLLSGFTSGWFAEKLFGTDRVAKFKSGYKAKMLAEIDKQLKAKPLTKQIDAYIDEIFKVLKQQVEQETDAWLDNTQNTLAEIQYKQERHETFNETEYQQLNQMRLETQKIISYAQQLAMQKHLNVP